MTSIAYQKQYVGIDGRTIWNTGKMVYDLLTLKFLNFLDENKSCLHPRHTPSQNSQNPWEYSFPAFIFRAIQKLYNAQLHTYANGQLDSV